VQPNDAITHGTHEENRRSLRTHREVILNYFRAQKLLSSGVVEGLNDKAKVSMRKSYGFRRLAWQAPRTGIYPRFLLTNQKKQLTAFRFRCAF
jgi:hypothetical protein